MIISSLDSHARYAAQFPETKGAFQYITSTKLDTLTPGKHIIDGEKLFVIVESYSGKPKSNAVLESHKRYLDIQIVLSGEESFGWKPAASCQNVKIAFNPEKDIMFYGDSPSFYFPLTAGQMALFFPEDAHAPGIGDQAIRKLVFKVELTQ